MAVDGKPFDTNVFFSGGAGMFLQYHDIVKPVYLYAIVKMILTRESFGLPIDLISDMTTPSIIEWYVKRRFINPFKCLDYQGIIDHDDLDRFMKDYLANDTGIYKVAPGLDIQRLFSVYLRQHMSFPVYVYSENEEPYIREDCKSVFPGIDVKYLHGDLEECIKKCDQNFTYIFSDIELVKSACEILLGTCSHVLIADEYRYNYTDNCKTFRYNLAEMERTHPFVRIGTTKAMNQFELAKILAKLHESQGGD